MFEDNIRLVGLLPELGHKTKGNKYFMAERIMLKHPVGKL